ncbi:expressed protein [Phakopsora pachyrhizi]|uniref:Expressed protein n=1 Tax=Phakopsora pachyrhizi TaxID=170000 RepID=A0AAV0AU92_PHAPC|nr:expressed protein [Phakopsora pachyrhizi]
MINLKFSWRIPEKVLPLKECSVEQMKRTIFVDVEIPKKTIEDQHLIRIPFSIPRSISKLPQRPKESFKLPLILSKICINASETIEIEQTIHENAKNNSRADDDDEDEKTLISIDELEVKNIELMKDIIDLNSTLNLKDSIFPNSKDKATLIYLNDMLLSVYKINSHQIKRRSRYFKIFKNRQDVNDRLIREYSLKEFLMNEREDELIKKIDRSMQMIGRVENRLIAIESMVSKNRCEQTDEDGLEKLKAVKTTAKGFFEVKKGTTSVSTSDFFARVWNFEGPDYTKGNFNGLVILIAIIVLVLLICTSQ